MTLHYNTVFHWLCPYTELSMGINALGYRIQLVVPMETLQRQTTGCNTYVTDLWKHGSYTKLWNPNFDILSGDCIFMPTRVYPVAYWINPDPISSHISIADCNWNEFPYVLLTPIWVRSEISWIAAIFSCLYMVNLICLQSSGRTALYLRPALIILSYL